MSEGNFTASLIPGKPIKPSKPYPLTGIPPVPAGGCPKEEGAFPNIHRLCHQYPQCTQDLARDFREVVEIIKVEADSSNK